MMKPLPSICLLFLACVFAVSCSKTTYYMGRSQTGVYYNQLALKTGGGTVGGFSSSKRRYRNGRQIKATETFHTIGLTFLMGLPGIDVQQPGRTETSAYGFGYPGVMIHYHPRINLARFNDNFSFSLDFPMQFGFTIGSNFASYPSPNMLPPEKVNFACEIPLTFNLNFGHQATKNSAANFGGFFGAGYSFAYIPSGQTDRHPSLAIVDLNLPIGHGPHFRAGIRFRTGTVGWQVHSSFMYNVYQPSHILGIGAGITFGRW